MQCFPFDVCQNGCVSCHHYVVWGHNGNLIFRPLNYLPWHIGLILLVVSWYGWTYRLLERRSRLFMSYCKWNIRASSIVSVERCTLHWRSVQIFVTILLTCIDAISAVLDHAAHTFALNDVIENAKFFSRSFMAPRLRSRLLRIILRFLLIPEEYLMILLLMRLPRLMILLLWRIRLPVFDCSGDRRWPNHLYRGIHFLLCLTLRSQLRHRLLISLYRLDLATLVACRQIWVDLLQKLGKFLIEPFTCRLLLLRILSLLCWNSLSRRSGACSFNCVYIRNLV